MRKGLFAVMLLALATATAFISAPAELYHADFTIWFDGNGDPVAIAGADVQWVVVNNDNGNVNVRAHGMLPEGAVLPDKAMHFSNESTGYVCGWGGTTEFSGVTTPSGRFSFTCHAP